MLPAEWFSNIWIAILLFIVGVVLIIKGGDWFVDAATWIAEKSGIPKFIIGATIVSLATTLPELIVSVLAAIEGHGYLVAGNLDLANNSVDMAIGNAIGSVNANIGLIMAISLIFMPSSVDKKKFFWKPILLFTTVTLLFIVCLSGELKTWGAIIVLLMLVAFVAENLISAKQGDEEITPVEIVEEEKEKAADSKGNVFANIVKFIVGAFFIVLGAELLIDSGESIAITLNVPTKIIALTIVAVGTSLPELVTTITAIVKKQSDLSVGNIIGANVIDMALILPVCSLVFGGSLPVANNVLYIDFTFGILFVLVAILPGMIKGKNYRLQGIALLLIYITYLVLSSVINL